jgi:hypothetical protein
MSGEAGTGSLRRVGTKFKAKGKAALKGSRAKTTGGKVKRIRTKTNILNKQGKGIKVRKEKKLTVKQTQARSAARKSAKAGNKGSRRNRTLSILRKARSQGSGPLPLSR